MSDMKACVPASMPLAQTISGVPPATTGASAVTTARIACAGTTTSSASARANAAASRVTAMASSIRTPGRNRLSRLVASCAALAVSCSHSVTLRPARAAEIASAVPQAPPPTTPMC